MAAYEAGENFCGRDVRGAGSSVDRSIAPRAHRAAFRGFLRDRARPAWLASARGVVSRFARIAAERGADRHVGALSRSNHQHGSADDTKIQAARDAEE